MLHRCMRGSRLPASSTVLRAHRAGNPAHAQSIFQASALGPFLYTSGISSFFQRFKMADQTERSFQKQPTVFLNRKKGLGPKSRKPTRYTRNVGLGFKTPREALEGTYIDKKCPFTGNVSIRGRILTGVVQKLKMQRTIVIRRDYLHYIRKYNRFEKRHRNMSVHLSPCFRDVEIGDVVTIGECRPLSKTVRFNVLKVTKGTGSKKSFKKF